MTASISAGTVAPSVIMRRLAAYPRQNALARALREIGCLERTLFILDWISDSALRRRSNAGLNKGEARNSLARALFFHRHGRSGTAPSKTSATVPPASISRSSQSSSGIRSTSATPLLSFVLNPKPCPTSCSPTLPRSAGNTALMATTFGHPNRSSRDFGPYEIRAPSSMLLSVRFGTDSAMTPREPTLCCTRKSELRLAARQSASDGVSIRCVSESWQPCLVVLHRHAASCARRASGKRGCLRTGQ